MAEPASKEQEWNEWNRRVAETMVKTQTASLEASKAFFDAWQKAIPTMGQGQVPGLGAVPFQAAGDAWIRAIGEAGRRAQEAAASGKTLTPDDYVDVWTRAASEVGQRIVEDPAFAQMTGQMVNANMTMREEAHAQRDARLKELGLASSSDLSEVARRLVELERRVHELTQLLRERAAGAKEDRPAPTKGSTKRKEA